MIRNLFFDIDDTILDFRGGEAVAIRKTLTLADVSPTDETVSLYCEINSALWKQLEMGTVTREILLVERFARLFSSIGADADPAKTQQTYAEQLSLTHDFMPGAEEMLALLRNKYCLCAITNGTASVQKPRMRAARLDRFFSKVFISQEIGYEKPDTAFFDACFSDMPSWKREETMVIGDSLSSDILGGIRAGLRTCWYNPHHKARPTDMPIDYEIHDLCALPALLEKINM